MKLVNRPAYPLACALAAAIAAAGCGSSKTGGDAGMDGGGGAGGEGGGGGAGACRTQGLPCSSSQTCCAPFICIGTCSMLVSPSDGAAPMCTYADGGTPDGGAFNGLCPTTGCAAGTVCVVEVGGPGGGGGEYCAPIPNECHGTPSCACMGSCACTNSFGGRPESCSVQNSMIYCDNGIR